MLIMRVAATVGLLLGLGASCLGLEIRVPHLSEDIALLGLLLGFAYVASEGSDFVLRMRAMVRKRARARRARSVRRRRPQTRSPRSPRGSANVDAAVGKHLNTGLDR